MATWLTRSLLFIVAGAVLAYAVTAHTEHIDLQTTGVILLLVGIFDMLLNAALTLYYRQVNERDAYHAHPLDRPRRNTRATPMADDDHYATREIPRRDPDWH